MPWARTGQEELPGNMHALAEAFRCGLQALKSELGAEEGQVILVTRLVVKEALRR
eukprot:CAMPEP_0170153964 /NCGR_PEP_ID=MMETSP0033_2-20121228/56698_1 /TAXON_ID=195969 /ORGANISM="Dolichomastix tenuilepis, Strain CCMP3274" /LENGTH=54 /DNA_ID=CAMNT_0010391185 /DNA_START=52 /DNA_END=212 /DNA_ORIENTATION=-